MIAISDSIVVPVLDVVDVMGSKKVCCLHLGFGGRRSEIYITL